MIRSNLREIKNKEEIMLDRLIDRLKRDETNWVRFQHLFVEKDIAAKTILLNEGEISKNLYFIKTGCLRLWFNNDGKDITLQFFFEGQAVASIDSFLGSHPSMFTIESIEPSSIISISKDSFEQLLSYYPDLKEGLQEITYKRFRDYALLFLSRIKDNPRKLYEDLLKNHPEIIKRVPQHYIASYLGITPISLSRIRNRK